MSAILVEGSESKVFEERPSDVRLTHISKHLEGVSRPKVGEKWKPNLRAADPRRCKSAPTSTSVGSSLGAVVSQVQER
jgi:hypothetical protein